MKDIRCIFGWHNWTFKFERGSYIVLSDPPPDHAKCSRCGLTFKEKNE